MYCKRCGKKLDAEDRFCSFCGSPVEKKETLESAVADYELTQEAELTYKQANSLQKDRFDEEWEREERREKFTFLIFGVLIVVLIAVITGGVAWMIKKESNMQFESDLHMNHAPVENDKNMGSIKDDVSMLGPSGDLAPSEPIVTPELIIPNENIIEEQPDSDSEEERKEHSEDDSDIISDGADEDKSEFIIYDSDVRYLVSSDLNALTAWEIRVARNEIYARHGRMFDSPELKAYFESKSWYVPEIPAVEFNNSCLSNVELENLNFIINYEKAHNLN